MAIETTEAAPPSGWYPDPGGASAVRWWTGDQWTDILHELADEVATVIDSTGIAEAEPEVGLERTDEPVPATEDAPDFAPYVPMSTAVRVHRSFAPTDLPHSTAAGWWLATLPLWSTALAVGVYVGIASLPQGFSYAALVDPLVTIVIVFVAAALTIADRKALVRGGHSRAASTWWFLLSPLVYLIARAVQLRRTTGRGWAPVNVWLALVLAPVVAIGLLVWGML